MKTIKLFLLFLLIPFPSLGQGGCSNGQIQIYIELWSIGGTGVGTNTLQISTTTGTEYLAVNFDGLPSYEYYTCLDDLGFGYTWIITSYDNDNPFNGSITINLDGPEGDLIQSTSTNGQSDANGTFVLEALVYGCTDESADNYDSEANADNGSCIINGCTDIFAFNHNPAATDDDGSCIEFVLGCIDNGTEISGSGAINDLDGDGLAAFNYNPAANTDDNSCEAIVEGCINDLACNYNSAANTNGGLCDFPSGCDSCSGEVDGTGLIISNDQDDDGICDENEVEGCTDPNAINYNGGATDDDGSCAYPDISGCINPIACNYNSNANQSNNLCYFPDECDSCSGETDGTGTVIDNDLDNDGVCDADEIPGCTDATACGYNPDATDDDESCFYAEDYYNCDGVCINDTNNNEICDESEIFGCITDSACNYNENANVNDGSCNFPLEYYDCDGNCLNDIDGDGTCDQLETTGCMDIIACNFNPFASEDDGSCETTSCYGCFDSGACNYNAMAFYPGSCIYASDVSECASCSGETDGSGTILDNDADNDGICDSDESDGCMDDTACNYNANATNNDSSCEFTSCVGCMEANACNYSPEATVSDVSCTFPEMYYDCEGACSEDDDNDGICNELEIIGCIDINACNYNPNSTDEGECNFASEYYDCDGNCLNDIDGNTICDELEVEGCTAPDACNYNENANVNDGSCDFPEEYYDCSGNCINDSDLNGICDELEVGGCTDSEACNYNANATMDNGTCEYLEVTIEYINFSSLLEVSSNASIAIYQWNINGEDTNINSDRLNPFINGLYTVSVYDEENDCWGEASYTVNDVSINEVSSDIKIFPNPAHNTLHINSKLNNQNTTIEVYNYLGDLYDTYQNMNSHHAQIDVSQLPSGIYIVKLKSQDFIMQKEFIKH